MNSVYDNVKVHTEKYSDIWRTCSNDISSLKKYSRREKIYIKGQIKNSLNDLMTQIKKAEDNSNDLWKAELKNVLKQRAKSFFNIKNQEFENIMISSFTDTAEIFMDSAKEFDRDITIKDIAQALRNVWIMNIIQVIAGKEVKHTPSIFAYSMLYPYTDNYLDDITINNEQKKAFNQRLEKRLKGESVKPTTPNEEKIYILISMIESEYPRNKYPHVFDSILCIHSGQCKSLIQQNKSANPSEANILNISVEKGGTSVLADAYLVCGNLDTELSDLMFGFGFILQLIDDLQDSMEDFDNHHMTVFSQAIKKQKLDTLTSKLINFTLNSLDFDSYHKSPYLNDIKKLIIDNTLLLVYEAIWENRRSYTRRFIKHYKRFSPFNYRYINRKMKKIKKELENIQH